MLLFLISFLIIHFINNKWIAFIISTIGCVILSFLYLPYEYNVNWNQLNLTKASLLNFFSIKTGECIGTFLFALIIHYITVGTYMRYKEKKQKEFDDWVKERTSNDNSIETESI